MKLKIIVPLLALLSAAVLSAGCSKDKTEVTAPMAPALSVSPADQTLSVPLDGKIVLTFAKPVDPKTVESGFHLISQSDMADSLCPVAQNMDHGDMNMAMMDTLKMSHLDQIHSVKGTFSWNSDFTQCTFTPDSMMNPNTTYMMHIGKNMMDMMNGMMGNMDGMSGAGMMGGMSGGSSSPLPGHMLMHFTTAEVSNTTGTGSGHLGHH